MAPLIKLLKKDVNINCSVVVTAQHRSQLDQVLNAFNIVPDYDLNVMKADQTLSDINIAVMEHLTPVLLKLQPNLVLVHGDTTTSFVSALSAFYNQIPIGHVEAGLRSGNNYEPFPEEVNRKLISEISSLHFAPTTTAKENLLKEGIKKNIFVTGNTAIDAISYKNNYVFEEEILNDVDYTKKIILLTAHRRENLGKPLKNICSAVIKLVNEYDNIHFIYPVHQNPKVREVVEKYLCNHKQITLIRPINVLDIHNLIYKSHIVLTDSGGLQEEAPHLNVPVLVMRNVTERPEGLKTGVIRLAGIEENSVYNAVKSLLEDEDEYKRMANGINPFGDGKASSRIVYAIKYYFGLNENAPQQFIIS